MSGDFMGQVPRQIVFAFEPKSIILKGLMEVSYKIIGGDGREYGPATLEELKSWVTDGRVGATTLVWRGDGERWAPALFYQELQPQIGSAFAPAAQETAGFWPRFAAYFLDFAIIWAFFYTLWPVIVSHVSGWKLDGPTIDELLSDAIAPKQQLLGMVALQQGLWLAYDLFFNGRFGATIGKRALGLRIVRVDGSPIGYNLAAVRWMGCIVSDFTFYLGYLFVLFRPDRRALHDLLAGTKVIFLK
jgi:uncharacterized RDD family membrane protein YckC